MDKCTDEDVVNYIISCKDQLLEKFTQINLLKENYTINKKHLISTYKEINQIKEQLGEAFYSAGNTRNLKQLKQLKKLKDHFLVLLNDIKASMIEPYSLEIFDTQRNLARPVPLETLITLYNIKVNLDSDNIITSNLLSKDSINSFKLLCNDFYNRTLWRKEAILSQQDAIAYKIQFLDNAISCVNKSISILDAFKFDILANSNSWKHISLQYSKNLQSIILELQTKDGYTKLYQVDTGHDGRNTFSQIDTSNDIYKENPISLEALKASITRNKNLLDEIRCTSAKIDDLFKNAVEYNNSLTDAINKLSSLGLIHNA